MERFRAERSGRQMGLEAGDPVRPDDRIVARSGRQLQPVADRQLDARSGRRQTEADRSADTDEDLVIAVVVGAVGVVWPVRPGPWRKTLTAEPSSQDVVVRHATETPIARPTA